MEKHQAPNQLNIEMTHSEGAACDFASESKGLSHQVLLVTLIAQALPEVLAQFSDLAIAQPFYRGSPGIDEINDPIET
jgi:hypothetical protein